MITVEKNIYTEQPKIFLRPKLGTNPFDSVTQKLLNELEAKGWEVPGIDVTFEVYGYDSQKYIIVKEISGELSGERFFIGFGREGDTIGENGYEFDKSGVQTIAFGKKRLNIWDNESGARLDVFVGDEQEWKNQVPVFHRDGKRSAEKINDLPRTGLTYISKVGEDSLRPESDLGQSYMPEGEEAQSYSKSIMVNEMIGNIESKLLPHVARYPDFPRNIEEVVPNEPILLEAPITLYARVNDDTATRLEELQAGDVAPTPQGVRGDYAFVSGIVRNDKTFPEISREVFIHAVTDPNSLAEEGYLGTSSRLRADRIIEFTLDKANDTYVVDLAKWKNTGASEPGNKGASFPTEESDEQIRAVARTMVPLTSYSGGYEKPSYLIQRELPIRRVKVHNDIGSIVATKATKVTI